MRNTITQRGHWKKTHYNCQLSSLPDGTEVTVMGWLQDVRDLGKIKFLVLRDSTGVAQVTVKVDAATKNIVDLLSKLTRESVIAVKGVVKRTEKSRSGFEVIPSELKVLNYAKKPLPLEVTGKTPADFETRMSVRFMDLRRRSELLIFKIQHEVLRAIRSFLHEKGFTEVFTPKILASATEGGAELFKVKYFDKDAYLAQSPQLYKEVLTSCFEKVYEIGVYFRAEESNTPYHLNEFVSVDIEAAFMDYEDVMQLLEECIKHVYHHLAANCSRELRELGVELTKEDVTKHFPRITYSKALEVLQDKGFAINWGEDLTTPALRKLSEEFEGYYFITDWPTETKPFYIKPSVKDKNICEAFDLMWRHIELASGGTRIHVREELEESLRLKGLNPESFKEHLKAFDYGMPPHAGWGLGLSRLIMAITRRQNIREVVLFPRDRTRLTP